MLHTLYNKVITLIYTCSIHTIYMHILLYKCNIHDIYMQYKCYTHLMHMIYVLHCICAALYLRCVASVLRYTSVALHLCSDAWAAPPK